MASTVKQAATKTATKTPAGTKAVAVRNKGKRPVTVDADTITSVTMDKSGGNFVCVSVAMLGGGLQYKRSEEDATMRRLAKVGGSIGKLRAYIAEKKAGTKLARGLNGRNAPNCSKAVADNRRALQQAKGGEAKPAKAAAPAKEPKKAKAPKKTADDTRKVTILNKAFEFGAEGTNRRQAWDAMRKAKTIAEYVANGGQRKYISRWEAAGAIKVG